MTKTKIKQLVLDAIHQHVDENREEILDIICSDAIDVDEDGEPILVDIDIIEDIFESILTDMI